MIMEMAETPFFCRVCGTLYENMDDMCPNRDQVCQHCCLRCKPGCDFKGDRGSLEDTENHRETLKDTVYQGR